MIVEAALSRSTNDVDDGGGGMGGGGEARKRAKSVCAEGAGAGAGKTPLAVKGAVPTRDFLSVGTAPSAGTGGWSTS